MNTDVDKFYCAARFAWKKWRRMWGSHIEREDAIQEATMACLRRSECYDPERSSEATYYVMVARSRMNELLRAAKTMKRTAKGQVWSMDASTIEQIAGDPSPLDLAILNEQIEDAVDVLDGFTARRGEAVRRYFGLGYEAGNQRQIAEVMGISHQRVNVLIGEGLLALRNDPQFSELVSQTETFDLV